MLRSKKNKKQKQEMVEKFRNFFMNYRTPVQDMDSSDSSIELDLSKSFEDILKKRKAELASAEATTSAEVVEESVAILHQLEYEAENSGHNTSECYEDFVRNDDVHVHDEESEAMERLLTEFGDNYEEHHNDRQLTPAKMVGLMRPSTIIEEGNGSSTSDAYSFTTAPQAAVVELQETSFETAHQDNRANNSEVFQFTPENTNGSDVSSQHFQENELNSSAPESFTTAPVIQITEPAKPNLVWMNNFNESSKTYQSTNASDEFTRDSLCVSQSTHTVDQDDDSLNGSPVATTVQRKTSVFDDTLEVVEYVIENDSKYVLKPVRKFDSNAEKLTDMPLSPDRSIEVIEIDSSPDTSYQTAQTNVKSSDRYVVDKSMLEFSFKSKKSRTFYDEKFDEMSTSITLMKLDANGRTSTEQRHYNCINLTDFDANENQSNASSSGHDQAEDRSTNTLDDVSSLMADVSVHRTVPLDAFNDSLERVEYMMEQGRRILEEEEKIKQDIQIKITENAQQKQQRFEATKQQCHTILKPRNCNSPKTLEKQPFKKPDFKSITPGVMKKPPIPPISRIPKAKSASKIPAFKHIQSPIGIYIKNSAPTTMMANVKPATDFFDSSYCSKAVKGLDFTLPPVKTAEEAEKSKSHSALPKKAYVCAEKLQITDARNIKIPGGDKVQKILGTTPMIIRHDGLGNNDTRSPRRRVDESFVVDDSFADMSLVPGDISVQIVRNVHRM